MELFINVIGGIFLLLGSIIAIIGGIGVLRFPDFYTRMHAAGVGDTLVTGLILMGLILQLPHWLVIVKLVIILMMTLFINPTASHALTKTAFQNGLIPVLHTKKNKGGEGPSTL
jgi:multicomponent Na+:H+ antiporter subunit G